jgi:hypothetical protein
MTSPLANQIVNLLNEITKIDPWAIEALCQNRISVNDALADCPYLNVIVIDNNKLGLIGILNGLLDITKERIAMVHAGNEPAKFIVTTPETHPGIFGGEVEKEKL